MTTDDSTRNVADTITAISDMTAWLDEIGLGELPAGTERQLAELSGALADLSKTLTPARRQIADFLVGVHGKGRHDFDGLIVELGLSSTWTQWDTPGVTAAVRRWALDPDGTGEVAEGAVEAVDRVLEVCAPATGRTGKLRPIIGNLDEWAHQTVAPSAKIVSGA